MPGALEPSAVLSHSANGAPITVAQGGGEVDLHTAANGFVDKVTLQINYPSSATGDTTVTVRVAGGVATEIEMPPGSVYEAGPYTLFGNSARKVTIECSAGDTALNVTGEVQRGGSHSDRT